MGDLSFLDQGEHRVFGSEMVAKPIDYSDQ